MLQRLYDWALPLAIERTTPVFALGGGVVGDLAGFAASTLLRGLPLVHVPTTLLAQVDSSIGGKTGINHACGKNLIGSFYPPTLVLSDANALSTLPDREFYSGLAEVVKHAILDGGPLLRQMEESRGRLLQRDPSVLNRIIPEAASVKATIVSADEREGGIRAHLNLGHTTGHAIETVSGYGVFTHGEAVSVGMLIALMVSRSRHPESDFSSAWRLVASLPVSPSIRQLRAADLIAATAFDKKRDSGKMRFVLLRAPGAAYVDEIGDPEFEAAWERLPEEST
jgi:3-dehydroquinate synthase